MSMTPFLYGLGVGFSLILAIGAQNAFVLKQGLKQQYVLWVCLICALSDSILMLLGVSGFSKVIERFPIIVQTSQYLGAAFLLFYGAMNFHSAITTNTSLMPSHIETDSLLKVIGMCLAFTWLNPHVYLDTLVLIGSISTQFAGHVYAFAIGAILASWLFFFSLGFGSRLLLPIFEKPISWKVLDFIIGIVMWAIAISLII